MPRASRKIKARTKAKAARKPKAAGRPRPHQKKALVARKPSVVPATAAARPLAAARPPAAAAPAAAQKPAPAVTRKTTRKTPLSQRRGPNGELLAPGELLLPGGPQTGEEMLYLFRGCVAAEHPAPEAGVAEVLTKRTLPDPEAARTELTKQVEAIGKRFESGAIEPLLPSRPQAARRNFAGVVERARLRRREIGAFLRGLHVGRTESSHMDSHGEASLQSLMEWAARLENLMEAEEPEQADYSQFHRGLDHLENTTEALIVDVEATLRRLRDRIRASSS